MEYDLVAYLGPKASYTHQAAYKAFPAYDLKPYTTIADVFAAVQNGEARWGVVPFENSTYGPVVATFDLLATALRNKRNGHEDAEDTRVKSHPDIQACGDVFVKVQHCLLGHATNKPDSTISPANSASQTTDTTIDNTLPSLSHITLVQSHEQALGQCKIFLSSDLKHAVVKEVSSTSRAAELAAADPTGSTAAICSEMAASMYGLEVLRKGIQDRKDNVTRFLVLEKRAQGHNGLMAEHDWAPAYDHSGDKACKTLVIFTVSHASPGALADSLAVFKRHGVNLTSINTRPSGVAPWNYYFFVEMTGSAGAASGDVEEDGLGKIEGALKDLEKVAEDWRYLGGWMVGA